MKPLAIKTEDRRIRELEQIRRSEITYIWGGGSYSGSIKEYLRSVGGYTGKFINIIDDEYYKSGNGDVVPFSEFLKNGDKTAPVVFGFYNYPVVHRKKKEWAAEIPNMYDFHLAVVNGKRLKWDAETAKSRENEYSRTWELLSDERSREAMQLYLNAATAGEFHELFTNCHEPTAYFNCITKEIHVDTLIDCGAYDGDSIHDFIAVFPDYQAIVAVEPDLSNLGRLRDREKKENIRNLSIINKGVGSKDGVLRFRANGASNSFFDESGDCEIQITTLDEISSELTGSIFLKMDIEGSELDALHGAARFIRDKQPILAICVYHREDDLIEIPRFIHETAGEGVYDYYLGFHGLDLAELVFYAVPKGSMRK